MKRQEFQTLIFLVALFSLACQKAPQRYSYREFEDPSGQHVFIKTWATCGSSDCSPSVGMIASKGDDPNYISTCTGFISDGGYFYTNDHCVPKRLAAGSSCYTETEVFFPAVGSTPFETARCSSVLWRSGDQADTSGYVYDLAVIKLATNPSRPHLKFDHSGVTASQALTVQSIDPDHVAHQITGTLRPKSCVVEDTFHFIFDLTGPNSSGCDIVQGNSGSPVVFESEKAVGIVHHSFTMKRQINLSNSSSSATAPTTEAVVNGGTATNFSCISSPTDYDYKPPDFCLR